MQIALRDLQFGYEQAAEHLPVDGAAVMEEFAARASSGFVPSSLCAGSGSKCRVRNIVVAPIEPATNLELGNQGTRNH